MQMWWISFVGACCLVITCAVSLPTTTDVTPVVPREFPNFNQNYTFVDNSSIRENLASHSEVDTEVEDLLTKHEDEEPIKQEGEVVPNPSEEDEYVGKKSVVEWIENGDDTEDDKFGTEKNQQAETTINEITFKTETTQEETTIKTETTTIKTETTTTKSEVTTPTTQQTSTEKSSENVTLEPYKDGVPVISGSTAAILVGAFLVICIFGYTALILWRRSLEVKYGSREMLVDSDDIFDPDDLKHFSI
ncbi:hypothetical protein Zmor_027877 [Zophobas morio]|uniref:Syndecan n=1 Tax=Zophobas morio TaxID=2755281 RepID=A0AA38HQR8_9CUCU|nr:hypothetical protein Zmor_027877 [Zophobas morio]